MGGGPPATGPDRTEPPLRLPFGAGGSRAGRAAAGPPVRAGPGPARGGRSRQRCRGSGSSSFAAEGGGNGSVTGGRGCCPALPSLVLLAFSQRESAGRRGGRGKDAFLHPAASFALNVLGCFPKLSCLEEPFGSVRALAWSFRQRIELRFHR